MGRIFLERQPFRLNRRARWPVGVDESPHVTTFYFHDHTGRVRIYQNRLPDQPDDQIFYDHVFGGTRMMQSSFVDLRAHG